MNKIKAFFRQLSPKQWVLLLMVLCSLILYLGLTVWNNRQVAALKDQQAAKRWDKEGKAAQLSCFFVKGTEVDELQIKGFAHAIEIALQEAATEKETQNSRLFVDAYSSQGRITVVSSQHTLEAAAVGIGGDFFFFHPLELVSGSYFSGNDLMKDSILLDEEAAWLLFGSSDIAGMSVMIGGVPHYVSGVVKREEGRFAKAAGLKETVVYVSNETLAAYGSSEGISTYEVAAPNPVKGFLYTTAKEKFGLQEEQMLVVENSSRFSPEAMIPVVLDFGLRSMQNSAVSLPYWENIARGYEDVRALVLVFQGIFLLIPSVIILAVIIIKWRGRRRNGKGELLCKIKWFGQELRQRFFHS